MGKKILAAWFFLFLVLGMVGFLYFYQEKYRLALDEIARVQETLSLIYDAQGNLSDAEAIARGFILTGDEGQVQIYKTALKELEQALDRLNRVTANQPEPQRLLGELTLLIGRRLALLQMTIDLRRLKGSEVPEHVVMTREGTKVQDEIRRLFDQLEDYGNKMLQPDWRKEKGQVQSRLWALYLAIFCSLGVLFLALYLLNREFNQRKQAEEKLAVYQGDLRSCNSQLLLVEERERRRIATHLHDEIGQTVTLATIRLRELQKSEPGSPPGCVAAELDEIGFLMERAIQETQSLTSQISSPILYELGLEAAIEWLTEQIPAPHGIAAYFECDRGPKPLDNDLRVLLFQAVRELLVNVVKHAQARNLVVSMWREPGQVWIKVADDGVGFRGTEIRSNPPPQGGFGLFSLRERLRPFGGQLQIESEPGAGATVTLSVPVQDAAQEG
jgi:signal transduction histidine kinase